MQKTISFWKAVFYITLLVFGQYFLHFLLEHLFRPGIYNPIIFYSIDIYYLVLTLLHIALIVLAAMIVGMSVRTGILVAIVSWLILFTVSHLAPAVLLSLDAITNILDMHSIIDATTVGIVGFVSEYIQFKDHTLALRHSLILCGSLVLASIFAPIIGFLLILSICLLDVTLPFNACRAVNW